jgi:energy-coupling factor transporter ATP-binding protein EcfA2
MRFRVENLGPIRSAELDLSKKLIVLAGPNNSGKTYLGWALYGLSRHTSRKPTAHAITLCNWLASEPGRAAEAERTVRITTFLNDLAQAYAAELHRDFAANEGAFAQTKITLAEIPPFSPEVENRLAPSEMPLWVWVTRLRTWALGQWSIFPVERLAINIFARELSLIRMDVVDELTSEAATAEESLRRVGRYPRAIRDALRAAIDLEPHKRMQSPFADLAYELEASVLSGAIVVTDTGEMAFQPTRASQALGIHRASSIVKSLSSIVFYLRHLAQPGHRIIIDEPELNLHPDNQRRVARVLAKAVNRGLHVVLSTHSDTLIGEFNNLIMLSHGADSAATQGVMRELGYDEASVLRPEDLGVYLVDGGACTPVTVGPSGFEVRTIDEAIHKLNQDAQTIYGRLFCE